VPWAERPRLKRSDGPWLGLYLWGRFSRAPETSIHPYPLLPKQVIYVGETKHLDRRPLTGDHHRLAHYRDTFPGDFNLQNLYVSVCRVHPFSRGYHSKKANGLYSRLRVYTQYVEARIYWEYTKKWRRPPALHYKKVADERN
jgi:hypothetical protein